MNRGGFSYLILEQSRSVVSAKLPPLVPPNNVIPAFAAMTLRLKLRHYPTFAFLTVVR